MGSTEIRDMEHENKAKSPKIRICITNFYVTLFLKNKKFGTNVLT